MEQVTLDLIPVGAKTVCHASQYDIGRTIRFNLVNNNQPVTLAGTETIVVKITKPDGTKIEKYLSNTSSTYVDWVTGEGDCDQAGIYNCEIKLTDGSAELGSKNFTIKVEEDPYNGEEVITEIASGDPAVFTTNLVDLFVEIKCNINAVQEGTPWIDSDVVNKEPYNYRAIAGTASRIGNSEFNKIVGGTVSWNQLLPVSSRASATVADITITNNNDGTFTFNGTYNNQALNYWLLGNYATTTEVFRFLANHVYLTIGLYFFYNTSVVYAGSFNEAKLKVFNEDTIISSIRPRDPDNNTTFNNYTYAPMIIDLTQTFGKEIADYVYNLEVTTIRAGVAWFRKYYPAVFYPYNAGSLMSSIPVAKRVIGKNLFSYDLPIRDGYWSDDGFHGSNNIISLDNANGWQYIRIPVTENNTITISGMIADGGVYSVFLGSENVNDVISTFGSYSNNGVKTIPNKAKYLCLGLYQLSAQHSNYSSAQVEYGSTATAYEPYKETIINLGGDILRGIPKLDNNNNLYYDGDTYESNGSVTRKFGIVTLNGTEGIYWQTLPTGDASLTAFYISVSSWESIFGSYPKRVASGELLNGKSDKLEIKPQVFYTLIYSEGIYGWTDNSVALLIVPPSDVVDLNTWLGSNNLSIVYELATPTTETADSFENPVSIDANGSEAFIDGNVYGIVDLGSLDYVYYEGRFNTSSAIDDLGGEKIGDYYVNVYCKEYANSSSGADRTFFAYTNKYLYFYDSRYTDATAFKNSLSGKYLIYEKASSTGVEMPIGHESFYADIYPISGHTELNLIHSGKNMFNPSNFVQGLLNNENGTLHTGATSWISSEFVRAHGTVTLQGFKDGTESNFCVRFCEYDADKNFIKCTVNVNTSAVSAYSRTFTLDSNTEYIRATFGFDNKTTTIQAFFATNRVQLELGSSATAFESYAGELVTVAFGQTVYGGVLDVKSGVLTITNVAFDMGTAEWGRGNRNHDDTGRIFSIVKSDAKPASNSTIMADCFKYNGYQSSWENLNVGDIEINSSKVIILCANYETVEELKTAFNGRMIAYELATPVEIQLTAHQLETILGQNILSHDCNGTTEVKYLYNA